MGTAGSFLDKEKLLAYLNKNAIEATEEVINQIEGELSKLIKDKIKSAKTKDTSIYDDAEFLLDVYPDIQTETLPSWVAENIKIAKVLGNSKQTVLLPDGRRYQLNNTLNHLSGGEWTYFTNSILNTAYKTSGRDSFAHKIRKIHPTPKPPQLMKDIISFFTKENEIVFDYFMGVGGTLLGAADCNRRAIGIELNDEYVKAYQVAAESLGLQRFQTVVGDCLEIMQDSKSMNDLLQGEKISLVLIDPPYGNMMSRVKTGADIKVYGNVATPFTDSDKDFGNKPLSEFFSELKKSVEHILPYVKKKGHIVIFIKDLQPSGKETNLLHSQIVNSLNEIPEVKYKGLKIWADQTAKLFPYGYPFSFVANQIHQYILIFRKEG